MKKHHYYLILAVVLLMVAAITLNLAGASPLLGSGAPTVVSYQGMVKASGVPYTGTGYFKFAIVKATGDVTYWSNDGTSTVGDEPTDSVALSVSDGLFHVLLGDTSLPHMITLPASTFSGTERYLRIWFSPDDIHFVLLSPDQQIAAVPYALQAEEALYASDADTVDGFHAAQLETHYQNVVIVAKSGGDFTTVQAAIDSITDASSINPYLVWVGPGIYNESVTLKSHVHLQGAGQETTIISSAVSTSFLPSTATLVLASHVSVRDLTVENVGTGSVNVAILAMGGGIPEVYLSDLTARAQGSGTDNFAIFSYVSGTEITMDGVTALADTASDYNYGLFNSSNAEVKLLGGSFTGKGGANAYGIANGAVLEGTQVTALGENGTNFNSGLRFLNAGNVVLQGGSFTGRGGSEAHGIGISGAASTLEVKSSTVLAENAEDNYGLRNTLGGTVTLLGGTFKAQGGTYSHGIYNSDSGSTIWASNAYIAGENCPTYNYGVQNYSSGEIVISQSVLVGDYLSVYGDTGAPIQISHSRLVGPWTGLSIVCTVVSRGTSVSVDGITCP